MKEDDADLGNSFIKAVDSLTRGKQITDGIITGVNETDYTCTVLVNETTFNNVPLGVLIGSRASVIQIPAVNSNCLMIFKAGTYQLPQILSIDTITKYYITIESMTLAVDNSGFVFNGGNNGGMVLVNDLVTRMNNIENAFNSHTHILTLTSGTGTAAPTTSTVTPTVASDIESTVIKQ